MKKYFNSLDTLDKTAFSIMFLFIILILIIGCSKEPIILENCLSDPDPNAMCTMEIDYQCGCNGYVYINPCHAYKDGVNRIRPYNIDEPGDNCHYW